MQQFPKFNPGNKFGSWDNDRAFMGWIYPTSGKIMIWQMDLGSAVKHEVGHGTHTVLNTQNNQNEGLIIQPCTKSRRCAAAYQHTASGQQAFHYTSPCRTAFMTNNDLIFDFF